jgi:polar amino acid transport system substrate-binding protein
MIDKKKNILGLFLIVLMVISAIGLSGCVEEKGNKIVVGTSADFPPFEMTDANNDIIGFDIELVTKILEDAGYTVEVQDIEFNSLISSLNANKIDVIAAALTINAERDAQIDFSNPYFAADQAVLIRADFGRVINSTDNLANLSIGAQLGTTGEAWITDTLIATGKTSEAYYHSYDLYTLAVTDLLNGNIDAVVIDQPVAKVFAGNENLMLVLNITTNEQYGFGVRTGDTTLQGVLNQGLESLIGTQYFTNLSKQYFEEYTIE